MSSVLPRPYWPCYCEENVWHLAGDPELAGNDGVYAAFISNAERQVTLWGHREALWPRGPIVWDYHVVLLARRADAAWEVWDLDTALGCPVPAPVYLDVTFPGPAENEATSAPLFRLLPAAEYRRELRTDRRHMRRADGSWSSPPPPWPPIGEGSNLTRFVDMESEFLGEVVDEVGLRRWLAGGIRTERRAARGRPTTRGRSR